MNAETRKFVLTNLILDSATKKYKWKVLFQKSRILYEKSRIFYEKIPIFYEESPIHYETSPTVNEWSPEFCPLCSMKTALYSMKRALCSMERVLHSNKRAVCSVKRVLFIYMYWHIIHVCICLYTYMYIFFRILFQSSELKAPTSLLPCFSAKRCSSFEL